MSFHLLRAVFILLSGVAGSYLFPDRRVMGIIGGFGVSCAVVAIELFSSKIPAKKLIIAVAGLLVGLLTSILVANFVLLLPTDAGNEKLVRIGLYFIFAYLGIMVSIRGIEELGFEIPYLTSMKRRDEKLVVIDTSVLIDGRIYDLIRSGFLDYTIIIPKFVIQELHELSDCSSDMKRQRGRRGLDILNQLKNDEGVDLKVYDVDFPGVDAVDAKLVKLSSQIGAKILTNDFNLSKVAEVQNVKVLNLNNLATLMRPRLMSGEEITLKIVKEGKESGQGIGYLEDGTMVVVENASHHIGRLIEIVIDSAIQTTTGRIIFAKMKG